MPLARQELEKEWIKEFFVFGCYLFLLVRFLLLRSRYLIIGRRPVLVLGPLAGDADVLMPVPDDLAPALRAL